MSVITPNIEAAQRQSILNLTKTLMRLRTDPTQKEHLNSALNIICKDLEGFTIEQFEVEGVRSILCHNKPTRPKRFALILNGHLDVIPGNPNLYQATCQGDRLYGVGSMDMKSNVAVMIEAFKTMASKTTNPIALQLVTDEEIGGFQGTGYQVRQEKVQADFVIAGESTGFNIANQARGVFQCHLKASGLTAHGAYPWRGDNAAEKIISALGKIQQLFPNPTEQTWQTTLNIANIETGSRSFNKIPDIASAMLDIRFIPEDRETLSTQIQSVLPAGVTMHIVTDEPAMNTPSNHPHIQQLMASVEQCIGTQPKCYGAMGTSDARFYQGSCGQGVEFGPIGGGIGSDDEWVSIQSLYDFYDILCDFISKLN